MPCYDPRGDEDDDHMRRGAALLCTLMEDAERAGALFLFPMPLQLWWAEHKKRDGD